MRKLLQLLLLLGVAAFLGLFMLLPIVSLVLVAFTGEPVNLVGYLARLDFGGLVSELSQRVGLVYYHEFWETRRYRQGLLNAVGLAPIAILLVFLVTRPGLVLLDRLGVGSPALRRFSGMPLMALVGLVTLIGALLWPVVAPASSLGPMLAPGETWQTRLLQSLGYCPLVTLASTAIGVAMAFCIARTNMPFRNGIRLLAVLPLAVPPFLGALAFKNLLGPHGMITRLLETVHMTHPFEAQGALTAGLVQAFLLFPFVVLTTAAALDRMDPTLGEAAEVMGARRNFAFWTVHLPLLMPGISAGAFLIFIRAFGDFAVLKLLMPTSYPMIVVEAYRDLSGSTYWGGASMLSTLMIAVILALLALQKYFVEGGTYETVTGKAGGSGRVADHPVVNALALVYCLAVFAVPLLFLGATILCSVARNWGTQALPPAYTLNRYVEILGKLFEEESPLFNSFALVLPALVGTTVLAFLIAYLISRSRHWGGQVLDFVCMLPFVVPGVAFAVALIGAFNGPPLALHFTALLVVIAYIVTRVPYGVRSTLASFQQIGTSMEESSKTMGGTSSLTLFKVTVPLVLPGVLAGAIMVFISAMQDVAITLMIAPPDWYPASVFAFKEIERGNIFGASAFGIVLLVLILIPYLIAYRLGGVRSGL
ncbi:MAG: iron ABC transporter permease [Armatimonadetes bacterium]|nr:iron ABC transporter permease [Armatimonadota bacterium]